MNLRQREPRQRDEKRLAWLRTQPCVICSDDTTVEAAHIRVGSINHGKPHTGMAEKPSDIWCLPLCGKHHREQHVIGDELKFWASYNIDPFMLAIKLRAP